MHPLPEPQPRQRRDSVRCQARLDAEAHAKLEALASALHRKRSAILCYVLRWGLAGTAGWTVDLSIPNHPHLVHLLVEPDLIQQVQEAADAHKVSVAAWLRHAMRQVTPADFPASWRESERASRSHDSGYYHRKFGLRLDAVTSRKLAALMHTFERSAAEIIREMIAQARPEDFPTSWRVAVGAHRQERDT